MTLERPLVREKNRGMSVAVLLGILVAGLAGCAPNSWFERTGYFNMAPRLEYQGFSFQRPPNAYWFLLQSEQSYTEAMLRRELELDSDTHSFYASVSLGRLERQPATHEEFAELARSKGQQAPYEIRTVGYEQRLALRQQQWCIRFESSHVAIGAPRSNGQPLTMLLRGYRCLHPAWPNATLTFFYSERGLTHELDPELSKEGEVFLDGVRIDVAPNTPAGESSPPDR